MSAVEPALAESEAGPADTDDLRSLRADVRRLIEKWRSEGRFIPRSDSWLRSFDIEFSKELARSGLLGMTWPRRFGGRESTNLARLVVTEELLRAGAPVAAHWIADRQIGPAILRHGSSKLQDEILPGIVSADYLFCLGMSEPEAGSDLASVRTSAKRIDDGWRVSGRKVWTSIAHHATHGYLLARTEQCERKYDGLTEFIVDMNSAGITVTPIVDLAGEHHFNEVVFDDVFVPEQRVLGKVGDGWRQVVEQLSFERGGPERLLSTYPLLIELLAELNGSADVHMTQTIGTLSARLAVLRQMSRDVARAMDQGAAPVQEAATLKLLGNQFERDVIDAARPLLGREGAAPRSVFGEALLASPGFTLRGGAADVLLSVIAKQELRV
ncbi:acyl-CoA dehydrogenase family protein [Nocardia rhamnosiphila]|uniref:Acyl-CoA dehydrogenase family protein n=1 Tax=Nocardia rhamnosiphila TaxID=426716 RepID=A0ABV2X2J7_9NOCA